MTKAKVWASTDRPGEIWRPVGGWEERYEVSNLGAVRHGSRKRPLRLNPRPKDGRVYAKLHRLGFIKNEAVHRMVATAFCERLPEHAEVNHIDGNPLNNAASNLEWCTRAENIQHSWDAGLRSRKQPGLAGERSGVAKLTEAEVRQILASHRSTPDLARSYGVSPGTIYSIRSGKGWAHIPRQAEAPSPIKPSRQSGGEL